MNFDEFERYAKSLIHGCQNRLADVSADAGDEFDCYGAMYNDLNETLMSLQSEYYNR